MHLHCTKASPTFISETSALAKGNASALPDKTRKHETAFFYSMLYYGFDRVQPAAA